MTAVIGLDVGGTNIRAALVLQSGEVLLRRHLATNSGEGRQSFLDRVVALFAELSISAESLGMRVAGIGAGVPGLIGTDGYIHSSVNLQHLAGFNLGHELQAATGLPVTIVNDANAIALGEKQFGAGRPFASLLVFTLGTGVGSGLILDDKLWTGVDGIAGEFGHATVEPDGKLCPCGNRGCLEQYASASAIVAAACCQGICPDCNESRAADGSSFSAESLAAAARSGNAGAARLYADAGRYLGIAAAAAVNLLNLEAVILCGGLALSFDLIAPAMRREIDWRAFPLAAQRTVLLQGALGDDAGLLGSAAQALNRLPQKEVIQ